MFAPQTFDAPTLVLENSSMHNLSVATLPLGKSIWDYTYVHTGFVLPQILVLFCPSPQGWPHSHSPLAARLSCMAQWQWGESLGCPGWSRTCAFKRERISSTLTHMLWLHSFTILDSRCCSSCRWVSLFGYRLNLTMELWEMPDRNFQQVIFELCVGIGYKQYQHLFYRADFSITLRTTLTSMPGQSNSAWVFISAFCLIVVIRLPAWRGCMMRRALLLICKVGWLCIFHLMWSMCVL